MDLFRFVTRGLSITTLAVGLLLLAAACGPEPTPTPEPEMSIEEVLERTTAHLESFQTARFQMIDEMESGAKFFAQTLKNVDGRVQAPNRTQMVVDVESPIMGFLEIGIVAVGDTAFMQFSSGAAWAPLPQEQVPFNFSGLGFTLSDLLPKIQNVAIAGKESLEGVQTIRIEGDLVSDDLSNLITSADSGHPIDLTVWVNEVDQSVRQIRIAGNVFNDDAPGTSRLIILSEYDEPVDIQLPETVAGS